jgi:putative PIN family toxin of toxin-antitoxin system
MIFLQAAARPTGPAAALLELVEIGAIELFVSDATLEELRDVLTRPSLQRKFPSLTTSAVSDFVERIKLSSICFANIPSTFPFDRDPKDAKYIDLALTSKADFLVTRDKDILDLRDTDQLSRLFAQLGWKFKIVEPFEMLSYIRYRDQT